MRAEIFPNRKGGTWCGEGVREVPCLRVWNEVCCGDRPQAFRGHILSTVETMCTHRTMRGWEVCVIGQLLLRGTRIVILKKLQRRTRAPAHEGHLGVVGTKQNLRTKGWWPGMDKAADRHCRACDGCQLVARPDPPEPIRSTALPDGP